MVHSFTAGAGA